MRITVPGFRGMVNVVAPQRLEDSQATDARNVLVQSGDLIPFKTTAYAAASGISPSGNDTIYKHTSRWLSWNGRVNVVRAPNSSDSKHRLYYADGSSFRVTDDDLVGGGPGGPASSRKVGLPVPTLADPTFTQAGTGTVSFVALYSANNASESYLPIVQCTSDHGLKTNDTILLNVPGFASKGALTVVITPDCASNQFRVRGFTLKKANYSSLQKPKNDSSGIAQNVVVSANAHPFNDGDIVVVHWEGAAVSTVPAAKDTPYQVDYQDTGHFQLDGTDTSATAVHSLSKRRNQRVVCIQDASDPFYGSVTYGDFTNLPDFSWDGAQYLITAHASSTQNTWVKTDVAANLRDRTYIATYVNGYGEEGPPSNPTSIQTMTPGTAVTFANLPTTSLYGPTDYNITAVRLYRTDQLGDYRLVTAKLSNGTTTTDIPYGSTGVVDTIKDAELAETIPTIGWYEPPSNLQGIILMPGGVIVGFVDKSIYACVPYIASAFPYEYQLKVDYPIVGLVNTAAGIVVLTQGLPSIIIGTDPASWNLVKLEVAQACASSKSIVDMGDYALYASPFGLIAIQQNDAQVVTESVFSRLQWQDYDPSNVKASFYEGKYFGSSGGKSFVFNPGSKDFVQVDQVFSAFYTDLSTDTLYVLQSNGSIAAWDRGASNLTYSWTSKVFQSPYPTNFGAAQVVSDATSGNPVTFYLYGDDNLIMTHTVTDDAPFRLPATARALNFQIKVTGSVRISMIAVANSVTELQEV
jgi:hypothetical protein